MRLSGGKPVGEGTLDGVKVYDYRHGKQPRVYVCRTALPANLNLGQNVFEIPLRPLYYVSASRYTWLNEDGACSSLTYLIRTAGGRHGKFKVTAYSPGSGKLTLKYSILNH